MLLQKLMFESAKTKNVIEVTSKHFLYDTLEDLQTRSVKFSYFQKVTLEIIRLFGTWCRNVNDFSPCDSSTDWHCVKRHCLSIWRQSGCYFPGFILCHRQIYWTYYPKEADLKRCVTVWHSECTISHFSLLLFCVSPLLCCVGWQFWWFFFLEVTRHLPKLFDNIAGLQFLRRQKSGRTNIAQGMLSKEQEYVPFQNPCHCIGAVR